MDFGAFGIVHENFQKVLQYSTPFGHAWTFVVIIFRLLPAIFLGDNMYGDELDHFECVTTQPGCDKICFTEFSPMQPPRMWALQILLSCLPPVCFHFYAARQQIKYERMKEEMTNLENDMRESEAQAENSSLMSATQKSMASHAYDLKYRRYQQFNSEVKAYKFKQVAQYEGEDAGKIKKILWSPKIRLGYIIHLILKFCFEMVFFYSVYWYQTKQTGKTGVTEVWYTPEFYLCKVGERPPYDNNGIKLVNACAQDGEVVCWVSRVQEKQIYIYYNVFMQIFSIGIIIADLCFVVTKSARKARRKKKVKHMEKMRLIQSHRNSTRNTSRMANSRGASRDNLYTDNAA